MPIHQILQQYWGYSSFRPLQEDIISSVLTQRDTLALLPTGGGKSICFQVPALVLDGICIVVSPLIALMQDQVEQLKKRGIPAIAIVSGMHPKQIDTALDNCIYGNIKFLYVSPERLQTTLFIERAKQMKVCLIAIDEAHCISQWGYDFRPPYLKIAEFRAFFPEVPLIALTATATKEVKKDILEKLEMQNPQVFQQSFARANLSYSTLKEEDKEHRLLAMLQKIQGTAVVYVRNRRRTQEIADFLVKNGINATFYHAGLNAVERSKRQNLWIQNQVRVIVATNAFGMGIDKADVRLVVHIDLPDTLEAYYQEAGRAGRDGEKAFAVALYNQPDLDNLLKNANQCFPPIELIRRVYQCLGNYYQLANGSGQFNNFEFDLIEFQRRFDLPPTDTYYAIKMLENEAFIALSDGFNSQSKVMLRVDNRQLYDFQLRNPRYDGFIKLLLRMYGGELFSTFLNISETSLAKAFLVPPLEIESYLTQLDKMELLSYDKHSDKAQITFLTPRFDANALPLQVQEITNRKEAYIAKAKAVQHYTTHQQRCRTQLLLEYFDEITDQECGVCDTCIRKKRQAKEGKQENLVVEKTKLQLLQLLANGSMSPKLILQIMSPNNQTEFQGIVRQLIEEDILCFTAEGNIDLHQKTKKAHGIS